MAAVMHGSDCSHLQAKRAATEGSEGARDRDPEGEDREAGFVEPGGAKPRPAE